MADTVHMILTSGATAYFQVRNTAGNVWNGTTFEAYSAANWGDYGVAATEQGDSGVFVGTVPSALAAGRYTVTAFLQQGGSPAEGDSPVAIGDGVWDGTQWLDLSGLYAYGDANWVGDSKEDVAAEILATPANKLATNETGQVEASNTTDIGTAVWATETRTLSSFETLVADITTAVWAAGTRTLTSFGTLVSSITTAVWAAASRTLTAFGFTVTASGVSDIKAVTDKLDTTIEVDGDVYKFTAASLADAPDTGDATAANQTSILAAIGALNNVSADDVATAVMGSAVDGAIDVTTALQNLLSVAVGKVVRTATDPVTLQFYAQDGVTVLATLEIETDGSERNPS